MKKVNTKDLKAEPWTSPRGRFASIDQNISEALGRVRESTDLAHRHPFDVEVCRIPAGKSACPYHSHSAQWEFYHVISGKGSVRDPDGVTQVAEGDAFLFEPGRPHQISSDAGSDLVLYIVADNPLGETCHYPDSGKWLIRSPERAVLKGAAVNYFEGEE
jgi:uncharacterized cupin superfamily protein